MMAAIIMCLVARVPDGVTIVCRDRAQIRIPGLVSGRSQPATGHAVLTKLTLGKALSCLPVGNEASVIAAKCTLPNQRDLACTLIGAGAGVRSDPAWRRYGLQDC